MALRPLEDIIGPLIVPVRGKEYTLPRVSLADGIRLTNALRNEGTVPWADLIPMLLGDVHKEMVEDRVPPAMIDRVLWTALADFQNGRESAEAVWEHGVPKAVLAELMTTITAKATQQAEATTTPSPASTNGTKSAQKPKAPRSRGKKSSPTSP